MRHGKQVTSNDLRRDDLLSRFINLFHSSLIFPFFSQFIVIESSSRVEVSNVIINFLISSFSNTFDHDTTKLDPEMVHGFAHYQTKTRAIDQLLRDSCYIRHFIRISSAS